MLNVTEPASQHLAKLLDDAEAPEGAAARFVHGENGLALQVDEPKDDDQTHEHQGRTVLLIDPQVADLLQNKTLDVRETEEGTALELHEGEEGGEAGEEAAG
jgi:Fe-S cluster assembly iron-binding protein IscA